MSLNLFTVRRWIILRNQMQYILVMDGAIFCANYHYNQFITVSNIYVTTVKFLDAKPPEKICTIPIACIAYRDIHCDKKFL